ncbi:MAG: ABC transporter permease [Lachnospiraceae bacterium]|jgi:ABC-2 type transport system permease protein|nr:ABC transporter permease [Lachnospiraceae bacterium]
MFKKLGRYLLFITKRERIISTIWIFSMVGFGVVFTMMYPSLFKTDAEMLSMAETMNAPVMKAMCGPVYGMDALSPAIMMAQQCLLWFMLALAVMNIFLVNRHTRVDEELGRLEMFRALPVGHLTGSLATIKFAFAVNLLIGVFTALGILAVNIEGTTAVGAFAYGLALGAVGFVFAALTLLAAQIFSTAHGVTGFGFMVLGVLYLMRASGDISGSSLSYISPLGLGLKTEAFYADDFMPIVILLAEGIVFSVIALFINAVRDHGTGVIPARKGRVYATKFLQSPFGLAWRLTRGTAFAWAVTMLILGMAYGSVTGDLDAFLSGNDMIRQMVEASGAGQSIIDSFVGMIFSIMSMLAAIPVMLCVLKIQSEEKNGRLEQIFAKSVPRVQFYGCFTAIALVESVVMLFLPAVGLVAGSNGFLPLNDMLKASFVYLPALWAMLGLCVLFVGVLPKLTAFVWVMFGYSFILQYFGRLFDLPEWAVKISPFGSIPQLPVQEFSIVPLLILTVLAVLLYAAGQWRFYRRDIG